jgi:toxin ParE1/3/4
LIKGYRLAKAAQDDLREIRDYTRISWGDKQARHYLSEIKECFETLVKNPELGKSRDEVREGLRSINVGRHVIFYRVGDSAIEVARILHGRMDVAERFESE